MKRFPNKVSWSFKLAMEGHGRNVKEALRDALARTETQLDDEFQINDFEAIERHEVRVIDEDDVDSTATGTGNCFDCNKEFFRGEAAFRNKNDGTRICRGCAEIRSREVEREE